jgi:ABC-type Fe3+ transport system permease subunit
MTAADDRDHPASAGPTSSEPSSAAARVSPGASPVSHRLHVGLDRGGRRRWCSHSSWMLITSFKTLPQLLQDPTSFWPAPWTLDNYVEAWNAVPFAQAYFNSIYICVLPVVGTLITASMAGVRVRAHQFRGSRVIFIVFLATQMIPKQVTLIPFYLLMSPVRLGRLAPLADRARDARETRSRSS